MSALVQSEPGRVSKSQRQADSFGGHEQRGRDGLHRRDELGDHGQLLSLLASMFRVKREPETAAADILDLTEAGHENVGRHSGVNHPAAMLQNIHEISPRYRGMLDRIGYRRVNRDSAIAPSTSYWRGYAITLGIIAILAWSLPGFIAWVGV